MHSWTEIADPASRAAIADYFRRVDRMLAPLSSAEAADIRRVLGGGRARSYAVLAATRAARRGLANVRLVHSPAEDVLFRCLAPGSVDAFHVYFADPWPKKRHHKRRFFRPDNVARLAELLRPGGLLRVKTDHREYAAVIAELLPAQPRLAPFPVGEAFATVPATHFEIKYAREGRGFSRLAFRRQGGDR